MSNSELPTASVPPKEGEKKPEEQKENGGTTGNTEDAGKSKNTTGSSKSGKGKSGKGKKGDKPKKKRMSKKELARIKREKAEQERLEQERIALEKQMQREKEEESRKRQEQQQRLQEEMEDITTFRQSRVEKIKAICAQKEEKEDWEIFASCDHSIDVRSEADVNTFIEQWSEVNETSITELFDHIKQSDIITNKLKSKSENHHLSGNTQAMERCDRQIEAIRNLIIQKIENITANILAFYDKLKDPQITSETGDLLYGMWVNINKNPRTKSVEPCPGVTI